MRGDVEDGTDAVECGTQDAGPADVPHQPLDALVAVGTGPSDQGADPSAAAEQRLDRGGGDRTVGAEDSDEVRGGLGISVVCHGSSLERAGWVRLESGLSALELMR